MQNKKQREKTSPEDPTRIVDPARIKSSFLNALNFQQLQHKKLWFADNVDNYGR